MFTFRYNVPEVIGFTKRSALKGLATVFDPRGLIAPFTIISRIMFQDAWLLQSEWDDRLPQHEMPVGLSGLLNFLICSV